MEIAQWLLSPEDKVANNASRIYIGYENYQGPMLKCEYVIRTLQDIRDSNRQATIVTPFLTEKQMSYICSMIEDASALFEDIEVVCNDWGLIQWLAESHAAEPVAGRLLVGQATDPRLAVLNSPEKQKLYERLIQHADGIKVALRYHQPTDALMTHLQSCSIATEDALTFLHDIGVRRFEVSNLLQGIQITWIPGWHVSLHIPEVPVAITRYQWSDGSTKWSHPTFPVQLHRRDNMVFYNNKNIPSNIEELGIDRLIYKNMEIPLISK